MPVEEVFEIPPGKALYPESGFEPLYVNFFDNNGESHHLLASNGMPYFFFRCKLEDIEVLPKCETSTNIEWLSDNVLQIWFRFYLPDGKYYLGIPFIFYLGKDEIGGMMHRWEIKWLLQFLALDIYLIYPNEDSTLLHYIGSAPVRFYEYKKEIIYDALVEYLGISDKIKNI